MNNNSMNLNNQSMENIKNLVDNGNISEAISQISPEMIQNFSKILSRQKNENQTQNSQTQQNNVNSNFQNEQNNSTKTQNNDFNFNMDNIDMNTIKNISSIMGNMNNTKNGPRANLLASLKPYLRDSKESQLDNYMNLLNVTKIAEIMKNTNTNNKEN